MSYLLLEYNKFKKQYHDLSGIALLVDNKICLVLPKKHRKTDNKYSIPKGHMEHSYGPFYNAYMELKEETGIEIGSRKQDSQFSYTYKKNGVIKNLIVFVINMTSEEFNMLNIGERDKKEIRKVKFKSKEKALQIVEPRFRKLIKHIYR